MENPSPDLEAAAKKAKAKAAHRLSMLAIGWFTIACAVAAAYLAFSRGDLPDFMYGHLGRSAAPPPAIRRPILLTTAELASLAKDDYNDAQKQDGGKTMKKYATALLSVSLLSGGALAHEGHEGKGAKDADVTMSGEVLDLACYAGHEAKGSKHAVCAKQCLQGGAPAGLLMKDGKVYVLVNDHDAEAAYQSLKDLGGGQAKVTGHVSKRGGLQALVVEKVEKTGN